MIPTVGRELDALVAEKAYCCRNCGTSDFRRYKDGRRFCPPCTALAKHKWNQNNPERIASYRRKERSFDKSEVGRRYRRDWQFRRRYGITIEQYEVLLEDQDRRCLICGTEHTDSKSLHVDHCHRTGLIRGLLCSQCNPGLALFNDSPERLRDAADYLERSSTK